MTVQFFCSYANSGFIYLIGPPVRSPNSFGRRGGEGVGPTLIFMELTSHSGDNY